MVRLRFNTQLFPMDWIGKLFWFRCANKRKSHIESTQHSRCILYVSRVSRCVKAQRTKVLLRRQLRAIWRRKMFPITMAGIGTNFPNYFQFSWAIQTLRLRRSRVSSAFFTGCLSTMVSPHYPNALLFFTSFLLLLCAPNGSGKKQVRTSDECEKCSWRILRSSSLCNLKKNVRQMKTKLRKQTLFLLLS